MKIIVDEGELSIRPDEIGRRVMELVRVNKGVAEFTLVVPGRKRDRSNIISSRRVRPDAGDA